MYRVAIISTCQCLAEQFDDYGDAVDWGRAKLRRLSGLAGDSSLSITRDGVQVMSLAAGERSGASHNGGILSAD